MRKSTFCSGTELYMHSVRKKRVSRYGALKGRRYNFPRTSSKNSSGVAELVRLCGARRNSSTYPEPVFYMSLPLIVRL
jgi:hypothetical protein